MPPGDGSVTLADVYELIAKEHTLTSQKLEGLRAEGRMRETTLGEAIARTEVNMRAYADDLNAELKTSMEKGYQSIREGVERETSCLQTGLDKMRINIFGNGDTEHALAWRVEKTELAQADNEKNLKRWEGIARVLFISFVVPLTLGILGALWMLISGQWELMIH